MVNWKFYPQVVNYLNILFKKKEFEHILVHSLRTAYWVKKLRIDADEALCIAAIAHDIDKAFEIKNHLDRIKKSDQGFRDSKYLKFHQNYSAKIIGEFLSCVGANKKMVERVKMLVSKHEEGGKRDQNILKDADSLSYFENVIDFFLSTRLKQTGYLKTKEKIDWMYNRISSRKAKNMCKKWYLRSIKKLEKVNTL
jgi:hypothetical protein